MSVEVIKTFNTTCYGAVHDAILADATFIAVLEQVVATSPSITSFFFDIALTGPEDTALDNILLGWVCPVVEQYETTDGQITDVSGNPSGIMSFNSDPTRNDKSLSTEIMNVTFSKASATSESWLNFAGIISSSVGLPAPYDGTIVRTVGFITSSSNNLKNVELYINGSNQGIIMPFVGTGGEEHIIDTTPDIDFTAGDKIQLRAEYVNSGGHGGSNPTLTNLIISLGIRWRIT